MSSSSDNTASKNAGLMEEKNENISQEHDTEKEVAVIPKDDENNQNDPKVEDKDDDDDLEKEMAKLALGDTPSSNSKRRSVVVRQDSGLHQVATWLRESSRIVVLSGAGVSCAAGIPDFRTPGTGLYDNLQAYNLPYPQAVFDLQFYRKNPNPFLSLAREIWPGLKHSPTLTHSFVRLLESKDRLLRNYTQNIDGLEAIAGISEPRLVECHGHFRTSSCIQCGNDFDGERAKELFLKSNKGEVPLCRTCGGYVKPDIVFFGQGLPDRFGRLLRRDLEQADLLIVMGTSLMVAPVSMIPEMVDCRRVLLNRELVGNFPATGNERDVFEEGDCDDSVLGLCQLMGWDEELLELNEACRIKKTEKE